MCLDIPASGSKCPLVLLKEIFELCKQGNIQEHSKHIHKCIQHEANATKTHSQ
jgi:hypothetical protein